MSSRQLLALSAGLALSACGVSGPVRTAVTGSGSLPPEIALETGPDGTAHPALIRLAGTLDRELGTNGIRTRSGAPYRLIVSLAESDASSGLTFDKGGEGRGIEWQSPPRRHHWYQRCHAKRLRAVAAGIAADGTPLRARAEADFCRIDDSDIDLLASELARAISRQVAPQG